MVRRSLFSWIIILAISALLVIFSWWAFKPSHNEIRIGIPPWPPYRYLEYANYKGFFNDPDFQITFKTYASLDEVRHAFIQGEIEGMAATNIDVLQARTREVNPIIVLLVDYSNGADVLLAHQSIHTLANLTGKRIATEPSPLGLYLLVRAFEKAGLSVDTLNILALSPQNMQGAIEKGKIDAVITYPPFAPAISKLHDIHRIFDSSHIPGEIVDTLSFHQHVLRTNPDLVTVIHKGWDQIFNYVNQYPDISYQWMSEHEGMTLEDFQNSLKEVKLIPLHEQADYCRKGSTLERAMTTASKLLHQTGRIEKLEPIAPLIHPSLREQP